MLATDFQHLILVSRKYLHVRYITSDLKRKYQAKVSVKLNRVLYLPYTSIVQFAFRSFVSSHSYWSAIWRQVATLRHIFSFILSPVRRRPRRMSPHISWFCSGISWVLDSGLSNNQPVICMEHSSSWKTSSRSADHETLSAFYKTRKCITASITAHRWKLFWASSVHYRSLLVFISNPFNIIICICLDSLSDITLSGFPTKIVCKFVTRAC